jgi:hypothetical protein
MLNMAADAMMYTDAVLYTVATLYTYPLYMHADAGDADDSSW